MRRLSSMAAVSVLAVTLFAAFSIADPGIAGAYPPSVVVYDPDSGGVTVLDTKDSGIGFNSPPISGTIVGADTLATAYLGMNWALEEDLLFYSSVTGRFHFAFVNPPDDAGHRSLYVFADVTGSRGWTHVVTGDYNGDGKTDILFYRATDGLMRFYTTSVTGAFTALTPAMYGTRGWTHLVVGDYDHDGSDDVLWYRARDGLMRFYEVTESGVFRAISPVYYGTRNWTTIPSGDYDGNGTDDLLFYRSDGLARFYEVDATGTFRALGSVFYPSGGYTQIVSMDLDQAPGKDLVWYHAGADLLAATRYNTSNVVNLWAPTSTVGYGDNLIIDVGRFAMDVFQ